MQTREVQGKLWSTGPADWAAFLEPSFIPMYQEVLKNVILDNEKSMLDAGCGSGMFLTMVSATGAEIQGIDAAPGLLDIARKRLPATTLLIEDLESIPFADESFDLVTGFNSFQYAGSFQNALAEAVRVTRVQGQLVIGIWGQEQDCDASNVLGAVGSLLPPPPPGTPGPFALSENGKVEAICKLVGLKIVKKLDVLCPWVFRSTEELQKAFMCTGPCVKAAAVVGAEQVEKAILKSAEPFRITDEIFFMRNYFHVFITEKI